MLCRKNSFHLLKIKNLSNSQTSLLCSSSHANDIVNSTAVLFVYAVQNNTWHYTLTRKICPIITNVLSSQRYRNLAGCLTQSMGVESLVWLGHNYVTQTPSFGSTHIYKNISWKNENTLFLSHISADPGSRGNIPSDSPLVKPGPVQRRNPIAAPHFWLSFYCFWLLSK